MDADAELDAAVLRHAGIALDHAVLHLDGAAHGIDHAAELDQRSIAGALDHAPVVHGDGRIDQVAAQRPQPRQRAIFVRAGEPAVSDHVGSQDRRQLAVLAHQTIMSAEEDRHTRDPTPGLQPNIFNDQSFHRLRRCERAPES